MPVKMFGMYFSRQILYIAIHYPFQDHLKGNIGFYGDVKVSLLLVVLYKDKNFNMVLLDKM